MVLAAVPFGLAVCDLECWVLPGGIADPGWNRYHLPGAFVSVGMERLPGGWGQDVQGSVFRELGNPAAGVASAAGGKLEPGEVAIVPPWGQDLCDLHLRWDEQRWLRDCLVLDRVQPRPSKLHDQIRDFAARYCEGLMNNHRGLLV